MSLPLERLVNGPMKEAAEKTTRFADLEVCDFERVCEFAYSGDYTDPETAAFAEEELDIKNDFFHCSESIASRESSSEDTWIIYSFLATSSPPLALKFEPHTNCNELPSGLSPLDRDANGWSPSKDHGNDDDDDHATHHWKQNITNIILGHARLYAFAGKYLINDLKFLALHKLHKFLADLTIYAKAREAIIELIQFVYDDENVGDRGPDTELADMDGLREMVLRFIMLHRHAFCRFPGHRDVLRQESEYAMDYAEMSDDMLRRLRGEVVELSEERAEDEDDGDDDFRKLIERNGWH